MKLRPPLGLPPRKRLDCKSRPRGLEPTGQSGFTPGLEEFVISQPGTTVLPFSQISHVTGQIVLNVMSDDKVDSADVDETGISHND